MATSSRKSSDLLPEIFQTERNKKFLSATIDQLVEPSKLEKLSALLDIIEGMGESDLLDMLNTQTALNKVKNDTTESD